eukprot:TRINITY_DN7283_c0_g4_i1.p1 TRINITY_DN7283_c0_g4~~TRINITY_DN7283_c0_g4_i1.p1  ORF type:complete len:118 (+),score=20.76 TRINITY_DN7283_c0_g4_i1:74-427(+)
MPPKLSKAEQKVLEAQEKNATKVREDFALNGERRIQQAKSLEKLLAECGRLDGNVVAGAFQVAGCMEEDHPDVGRDGSMVPGSPGYKPGVEAKKSLKDARHCWPPECASPDRSTVNW